MYFVTYHFDGEIFISEISENRASHRITPFCFDLLKERYAVVVHMAGYKYIQFITYQKLD